MRKTLLWCGMFAALACAADVAYVDEFDLSGASCGMGLSARARTSVCGNPIRLGEGRYARGVGVRPESAIGFTLDGKATAFDAVVGIDRDAKDVKGRTSRLAGAIFRVWCDGKIAFDSGTITEKNPPRPVHVDLAGVKELVLETASYAPWCGLESSNADWADAKIAYGGARPVATGPERIAQLGILTPPTREEPQFNGAEVWGVRPGRPVIFRVPVSGVRPMTFTAEGVPDGVTFDAAKGILGGTAPAQAGDYPIRVTAVNAKGTASRTITLKVGETICLTPPMGWNSWNIWGPSFTMQHAMDAAKAMDESGLGDHGWAYINLDDWWEMNNSGNDRAKKRTDVQGPARDADGRIRTNGAFPDMKKMTDYIHALGFKAGIYSSPGPLTCGECEGSYGHEMQDATSYAEWGFDYLKYDWCSYGKIFQKETGWNTWEWMGGGRMGHNPKNKPVPPREAWAKPYRLMQKCLRAQNRDIVYAYCQYGCGETEKWGREAGANVWRTWQDMKDTWTWMRIAMEGYVKDAEYYKYTGPGFWADPDMMIVGLQRSFGTTHPTYLTRNEQYAHVSMWCLLASPLLIGTDLTRLDDFTKSLLVNDELIAINQDTLGRQARRVVKRDAVEVWVRPLANGDYAVGVLNLYPLSRKTTLYFSWLDLDGEWKLRDCWSQRDLGRFSCCYTTEIPAHAALVLRMSR